MYRWLQHWTRVFKYMGAKVREHIETECDINNKMQPEIGATLLFRTSWNPSTLQETQRLISTEQSTSSTSGNIWMWSLESYSSLKGMIVIFWKENTKEDIWGHNTEQTLTNYSEIFIYEYQHSKLSKLHRTTMVRTHTKSTDKQGGKTCMRREGKCSTSRPCPQRTLPRAW